VLVTQSTLCEAAVKYAPEDEVKRVKWVSRVVLLISLAATSSVIAQFGHPLTGSWSGDWGTSKEQRNRVLLDIQWDGKALRGTLNGAPLTVATVNPETWAVRFEADTKDASGNTARSVLDGKLENLGAYQRFITGTWMQGSTRGDFKVTRN
jgi:hypothetical protein